MSEEAILKKKKLIDEYQFTIVDAIRGENSELIGLSTANNLFNTEYEYWSDIKSLGGIASGYSNYVAGINNQITSLLNRYQQLDENTITQELNNIKNSISIDYVNGTPADKYIYSSNDAAQYIKDLYIEDPHVGMAAHHIILNKNFNPGSNSKYQRGIVLGALYSIQNESKLYSRPEKLKNTFSRLYSKFESERNSIKSEYENYKNEVNQWQLEKQKQHEAFTKEQQDELFDYKKKKDETLSELENLYKEKLKLEAPVEYWKKRAIKYRNSGSFWTFGLVITITLSALLLFTVLYDPPNSFAKELFKGEPLAIRGIVTFITLISFFAYLTKTFAKMIFSSFHLQRDAEEREQLTLVYLALIKEGSATEEERDLILQAIFSRSDTGLLTKDSHPTMPGLQGVLEKIIKGK